MEQDSLEENTAECVQASKAHLPSLTSWRYPHSARAPTTVDALLVGQTPGSTQDHPGQSREKNGSVDGVKSLTPAQRLTLAQTLTLGDKAAPVRRVWIPKPGSNDMRPLGIPTIHDRALQALAHCVLEPEWEARFEPNSYGFRPGRSCHDAIEAIFTIIG